MFALKYIDGCLQDCSNSSALGMVLLQFWTMPSIYISHNLKYAHDIVSLYFVIVPILTDSYDISTKYICGLVMFCYWCNRIISLVQVSERLIALRDIGTTHLY